MVSLKIKLLVFMALIVNYMDGVHSLKCYVCKDQKCKDGEKGEIVECGAGELNNDKTNDKWYCRYVQVLGDDKWIIRTCAKGEHKNGCQSKENVNVKVCFCSLDHCNEYEPVSPSESGSESPSTSRSPFESGSPSEPGPGSGSGSVQISVVSILTFAYSSVVSFTGGQ